MRTGSSSRRSFPWAAPEWPARVPRPPADPDVGVDYDGDWARRYPARLARAVLTDTVTAGLVKAVASPKVTGAEGLGALDGPVIFAANHASHVDTPLLITALPDRYRHRCVVGAGSDYFFDRRWKAATWSFLVNAIPIERQRVSRRSADLAAELVTAGWSLALFPEGGRSPDGWGQAFRGGAAYLAIRTGTPVVPVHLGGTGRVLAKGQKVMRRGPTTVTFGRPLRPLAKDDARRLSARLEAACAALADEVATDWWTARRRAAGDSTPSTRGPDAAPWRRAWALGERGGAGSEPDPVWPGRRLLNRPG